MVGFTVGFKLQKVEIRTQKSKLIVLGLDEIAYLIKRLQKSLDLSNVNLSLLRSWVSKAYAKSFDFGGVKEDIRPDRI